jgi:hypothetical protein
VESCAFSQNTRSLGRGPLSCDQQLRAVSSTFENVVSCERWAILYKLRQLVAGFPPQGPGFKPRSGYVGFVVDKATFGQVFSEYFCFPCQSLHRLLHNHHPSSMAGAVGQIAVDIPIRLGLAPSQEKKNMRKFFR